MNVIQHALAVALLAAPALAAAQAAMLAPLESGAAPPAAWRNVSLPAAKGIPPTKFSIAAADGERALEVRTQGSYGNLVHTWQGPARALQWRWRLQAGLTGADLRSKQGDDVALKVCLLFDMPLSAVPFGERASLALARAVSGEALPSATLCYVWDTSLPPGTLLPNAFSARVRYLVLDSGPPRAGWETHRRDVGADFLRAFGNESSQVPAVTAVAVGGDADNTGGASLGYIRLLTLEP
ncbi:MAG: DUF3047 domain-containing protein [Ramlibacter sp.]